jgi:UDP-3-O-[3-hydroxymyristoyl] N-acetylglucosamine deacetylase
MTVSNQKTIINSISCNSTALHSGKNVNLKFLPAPTNTGIVFKRVDIPENNLIEAKFNQVTATNLGTTIANLHQISVSTIEHLMSAIWASGIDNLIIEIDNQEVPIMDGSASPFIFLLQCAGITNQEDIKKYLIINQPIEFCHHDKFIKAKPSSNFKLNLTINFNTPHIVHNELFFDTNQHSFKDHISKARTFCFKHEIEQMNQMNLAKGGSLENAIVIDDKGIINTGGLRYPDEFVKHKALDFIGDIFLSGYYILADFTVYKSGHTINNKFLHYLFNKPDYWYISN